MTEPADWKDIDHIMDEVVISEEEIQQRVRELGREISQAYEGKQILLVGILRGAFVFMADLIRHIDPAVTVDFMLVSSYEGTESSGHVRILKDTKDTITDLHVLIIEDIVDTGQTYASLRDTLLPRDPASLRICTLLNKPSRRVVDVDVDFQGFEIGDQFVVGYGLDYQEFHRETPFIFVPTPEAQRRLDEP